MKTLSIKFMRRISLCFAFIIISPVITWCCGPTLAADESRFALFRQGLDNNSGLNPFNYSEDTFNFLPTDPEQLDYKRNCNEWVSYCGNSVKPSDVYEVQYKMKASTFLDAFSANAKQKYKQNSFINWLSKKRNSAALTYMALAKDAESTQFKDDGDPWDTGFQKIAVRCENIAIEAADAFKHQTGFLKERYAFQAIKMYYYGSNDTKVHDKEIHALYDSCLAQSKSIIAGWALVYYAMSEYNVNKRTAALLYAFDKSDEKKEFCSSRIEAEDLTHLEKNTNDKNLLVLVKTLQAVKNRGKALNQLQSVFNYNSNSKYLPLLITREINKLENWLWSPEMLYFSDNRRPGIAEDENKTAAFTENLTKKDNQYLKELSNFIESNVNKTAGHKIFMQLALIHLYNMQRAFEKANKTLLKLDTLTNPRQETQRLIEQVITTAHVADISSLQTQQQLADCFRKLIILNPAFKTRMQRPKNDAFWEQENGKYKNDSYLSQLFILLSHCFEKKSDVVTAGLLQNKANITINRYNGGYDTSSEGYKNIAYFDRIATPKDIDKLLALKHKKQKTSFEQFISPVLWGSDDHYRDLKGTILFRQKKYRESLAVFESMKPDYWNLHEDFKINLPSASVMHTGKMIPSETTLAAPYSMRSKRLIVKDIVNLLDKITAAKNNEQLALLYYRLSNAYFNTTHFGKAWMMFSYGKSGNEFSDRDERDYSWAMFTFYPNNIKYADYYYNCKDAIAMYKKAFSFTTNRELAAKCLLAISVCDKIRNDHSEYSARYRSAKKNNEYNPVYLRKLKAEYSNTKAFREAAEECPDVRDFLSNSH